MFLESSSIIKALPFWNKENGSSSQKRKSLDSCLTCSSLCVPETSSLLDSWGNLWDLKPGNEGGNLFSFDAAMDGRVEPQLLWCRKLPIIASLVAWEQAIRCALAAGREKEGDLATKSLEFEFHVPFLCGCPSTELSDFRQSAWM